MVLAYRIIQELRTYSIPIKMISIMELTETPDIFMAPYNQEPFILGSK